MDVSHVSLSRNGGEGEDHIVFLSIDSDVGVNIERVCKMSLDQGSILEKVKINRWSRLKNN
jgi:hypothetical protein